MHYRAIQCSNLLLAHANTDILGFGFRRDSCPNSYSFWGFYMVFKFGASSSTRGGVRQWLVPDDCRLLILRACSATWLGLTDSWNSNRYVAAGPRQHILGCVFYFKRRNDKLHKWFMLIAPIFETSKWKIYAITKRGVEEDGVVRNQRRNNWAAEQMHNNYFRYKWRHQFFLFIKIRVLTLKNIRDIDFDVGLLTQEVMMVLWSM
jgi:hypothetical protein